MSDKICNVRDELHIGRQSATSATTCAAGDNLQRPRQSTRRATIRNVTKNFCDNICDLYLC
ncbi:MAG: hypothetical protein SR1Q7_04900 [Quinella sp. 1Q7]|nr:hypothetical protein [Quinella sp. 1Q7]